MAKKERFEPQKSGAYVVGYADENGFYREERVLFDAKGNMWIGTRKDSWYKEHVSSWQTPDNRPIC